MKFKTHIIYLKNNDFSVKMANEARKSVEQFGIECEMFDGVTPDIAIDVMNENGVRPSKHHRMEDWTPGTIGCFASHYLLWKKCSEGTEPFVILEHDGIMLRDPSEIVASVKDICHLDSKLAFNTKHGDSDLDYYNLYNNMVLEDNGLELEKYPTNNFYGSNEITGSTLRQLYGYVITPQGGKKILEFTKQFGAFPADKATCERAMYLQRSKTTFVRLNPYIKTLKIQREVSTR